MFLVGFDRKKKNAKQKISTFFFLSCICLNCCFLWIGKVQTMGGLYSVFFFFFFLCVCVFFLGNQTEVFVTFFECQAKDICVIALLLFVAFRVLTYSFFGWGLG
jgi:uncharacterized integral membrane protein